MRKSIVLTMSVIITVIPHPSVVFASEIPDDVQKSKIVKKAYRMSVPFIENGVR